MRPTALYLTALAELDAIERDRLDRRLDRERSWRWPISRSTPMPASAGRERAPSEAAPSTAGPASRHRPSILSRLTRPV